MSVRRVPARERVAHHAYTTNTTRRKYFVYFERYPHVCRYAAAHRVRAPHARAGASRAYGPGQSYARLQLAVAPRDPYGGAHRRRASDSRALCAAGLKLSRLFGCGVCGGGYVHRAVLHQHRCVRVPAGSAPSTRFGPGSMLTQGTT